MNNPNHAIQFVDLSLADAINVNTRVRFTDNQLRGLADIPGITRFNAGLNGSYTSSISARMNDRSYLNSVSKGRLFTFEELAPQILLVFADALGVEPEEMTVTVLRSVSRTDVQSGEWIVQAARKLRPKLVPAPRNPNAPFAATLDDIKPGVELMTVRFEPENNHVETVTVKTVPSTCRPIMGNTMNIFVGQVHSERRLSDIGVMPYVGGNWSRTVLTIVNTPKNRRKLVNWLMERRDGSGSNAAFEIVKQYIDDFVSVDTTRLPKGFVVSAVTVA